MSEDTTTDDAEQTAQDILDESSLTDEPTAFATDFKSSIDHLTAELDLSGSVGGMPLPMVLNMLLPMLETKATEEAEDVKQALAIIHLESGALLEKHDDRDPEDIL